MRASRVSVSYLVSQNKFPLERLSLATRHSQAELYSGSDIIVAKAASMWCRDEAWGTSRARTGVPAS